MLKDRVVLLGSTLATLQKYVQEMTENKLIRIIVTDDQKIMREGLRLLLEQEPGVVVVGEAANGKELLELLAHTPADVVLLDVSMPFVDGYEATRLIRENYSETKVVVLSMQYNEPSVHRMLENGALGYVLKSTSKDELFSAIRLAAKGTPFICSGMSMEMLQKVVHPEAAKPAAVSATGSRELSKREIEVLTLISDGYTNAEIADKLFTSKRTIETHRQNILEKTQAKNTAHLIKYAIQHKLIDLHT